MYELLDKFSPGHLIGLAATVLGIVGWIITTVAGQWRRVRVAEIEASLKQQMLERGLDPAEIEQVLCASKKGGREPGAAFDGTSESAKACSVKALTDHEYDGAAIERVLRAFGRHADRTTVEDRDGTNGIEALSRALAAKLSIVQNMAAGGQSGEDIERALNAFTDDADWRLDRQPAPARV